MEDNLFNTSNVSVCLVFIFSFLLCFLYLGRKVNLPPGPRAFPLVGNIVWFNNVKKKKIPMHKALCELGKTHGDVIALKLFGQVFVYLQGFDAIREAFVKNADVLSDRPSWLRGLQEAIKEGKGVLWQSGQAWKVLRKFVLQALRDFGVGKTSLEENIMQEVDALTETLNKTEGEPIDVRLLTTMMITNVIYGIIFAKRFDYNDEELNTIIEKMGVIFRGGNSFSPQGMIPMFLLKIFRKKDYKIRQNREQVFAWIKEHIYEEIKTHESTFDNENIRDFVDLYLQAKNERSDADIYNKGNMFRVIMDLFIAGSDTTSTTINWCVLYMQEYPELQKRCLDEINEKLGNRVVNWADRGTLPYTEATLLEIQRMANIAPMSLPHTNEVETTIGGYFIPRRSLIVANLYSANMDSRHWDQPDVFNPDRFLDGEKLKKKPALIPFSTGPRVCLGESLAKMEMFLIFTNLLQRFKFCREDDNIRHTFESVLDGITSPPVPYKTCAVKRA